MALTIVTLLAPPAAVAHRDPTIAVRLVEVSPKLPTSAQLDVLDSELTYAVLTNRAATPLYALDPKGDPFLRVSLDGAFGNLDSPYLGASARAGEPGSAIDLDCCPEGTWLKLSDRPGWVWPDPRLDPPLGTPQFSDGRGLGRLSLAEPLATWEIGLRYGAQTIVAKGELQRRLLGEVTTTIESAPEGIRATIIESRPPQIRIQIPRGARVEVLGQTGEPFIRMTPVGTVGRTGSNEFDAHREAVRLPPPRATGWVPMAGTAPTRATWADTRLKYSEAVPADPAVAEEFVINRWRIPLRVNGEPAEITGSSTWRPVVPPVVVEEASQAFWGHGSRTSYILAGGMTVAVFGAYLLSRTRRKGVLGPCKR